MARGVQRRVFLHVGGPKSGTTYLQERLQANPRALRRHGVRVPHNPPWSRAGDLPFRAALDLTGRDFGGPSGHADGAWVALVRQVRRTRGTIVVSHEQFATATDEQVGRAHAELAERAGAELHLVFTARDPARSLPAAWQESVKQGRSLPYRRFLDQARAGGVWFARAMDVEGVLGTWGAGLPGERLHLVTVPRPGGDSGLLWRRFCEALDIDPDWADPAPRRANESLGVAETQLLRQLNGRFGRQSQRSHETHHLIKNVLAEGALAARESDRIRLPPSDRAWAEALAERWIEWSLERSVRVHGDLAELRPEPDEEPWVDPDRADDGEVTGAAVDALTAAVEEAARRRDPEDRRWARLFRRT